MRPAKGYVYEVASRIVNARVRLFRGRPIAHESLPGRGQLIAEVITALPTGGPPDWEDPDMIGGYVDQFLGATPWPFDLLLTATSGTS